MTMPSPIHSHPMSEVRDRHLPPPSAPLTEVYRCRSLHQLDIELAALLDSLSLQQRIRVSLLVHPPQPAGFPADSDLTCVWRQTVTNEPAPTAPTASDIPMNDAGNYQVSLSIPKTAAITDTTISPRRRSGRGRSFPNPYLYLTPFSLPPYKTLALRLALTNLEPVRHYGLLKFLRRSSLAPGHGHSHSHSATLRTPGGPHAFLRPGRGRRATDDMRGVPRAYLHTPRSVRRAAVGARGVLGGVQCARARAGAPGVARR